MRSRITERLSRSARYPVTLITGPAGFGKSVALRDFLETSRVDAMRYDVRREDDSLLAFARGLSLACEAAAPGAAASFPSVQQRVMESPQPARELCDWFCEHLRSVSGTFVIDDLHFAGADAAVPAMLGELIERTSERISWIVASRTDAGLPVASWLAYGRMDLPIDERELRFTSDEALAAAEEVQSGIDVEEVGALLELTEGWAAALSIALRTRTHAGDLRSATAGTREFVYRYLAEQVFARLSEAQRTFVTRTAVFSTFTASVARALGGTPEFLAGLRQDVGFLNEDEPGRYRYQDLFRDYAESELRRAGEREWREAQSAGARLLEEEDGDELGALKLFSRAGDADNVLRILARSGVQLFERGHGDALGTALDAVDERRRSVDAAAVGMRAMLDAARGHFDLARREFASAISLAADVELRFALVHRFALELVRHEEDCAELLEGYARDESIPAALRVPLLGTLATALARNGLQREASETVATALDLLDHAINDDARARLFQQAAFVYLWEAKREDARTYATRAVDLALSRCLYEVAVRAYSVLYQIAYDDVDDPIAALTILDRLLDCARKGCSTQARLFGLMASCWIEAERGDDVALARIEDEVAAVPGALPRVSVEALLPATALRAAWSGDFRRAHQLLGETAAGPATEERVAYRSAELALYGFAAGYQAEGESALAGAYRAITSLERPTRRGLVARILMALAELARGHDAAAHRLLLEVDRAAPPGMVRVRAFANAARTLYRVHLGQAQAPDLAGALERLRAAHYGGMARLMEAVPFRSAEQGGLAALTHAEREVLTLLAGGASSKDVAARTGRSPRTVDVHIRSICQKLGCSGRRAAVAIATAAGWV
ncbi:MAG TPA: LuxR C-terminal-related transcriptional regulator [Candidatus Acidoferrales bacterium]|nr:LuxR C-terminal-related transcriptional regulator [Candidatus Acidoferrales bacterium]